MEFRQLTYFLAAAQTQNFRKAAELCLVAQSALSRQIAALEEELGVELFRRVERRVILTTAGQEFAGFARNALAQLQQGQQAMVELEAGERGMVTLGCVEALATAFLPVVFADFHRQHPNVRLRVKVGGADTLMEMVEQGELDFGLVLDPYHESQLLLVHEIIRQPIRLITALDHPLTKKDGPLWLHELQNEPMLILGAGYGLYRIVQNLYRQHGLNLQPLIEIDSVEALKEFVRHGVGVTFMPPALMRPGQIGTELAVLPVADLSQDYIFALIQRRTGTLSKAARGFVEYIMNSKNRLL